MKPYRGKNQNISHTNFKNKNQEMTNEEAVEERGSWKKVTDGD